MKKKIVTLAACSILTAGFLTQGITADAAFLNHKSPIERIADKKAKIAERKEALKSLGASDEVVEVLDRLNFFDIDFVLGKTDVDVSTMDKVSVILENSNIDIDIYINIITINK